MSPATPARGTDDIRRREAATSSECGRRVFHHAGDEKDRDESNGAPCGRPFEREGRRRDQRELSGGRNIDLSAQRGDNRALMIGFIGVVVQPLMQRRRRRHGEHEQVRADERCRNSTLPSPALTKNDHFHGQVDLRPVAFRSLEGHPTNANDLHAEDRNPLSAGRGRRMKRLRACLDLPPPCASVVVSDGRRAGTRSRHVDARGLQQS